MRTAIYTRISKDSTGEEAGVDRQLNACTALADRLGWDIVAKFSDNDISAYQGHRRPGFEALLAAMESGEFSALIIWHVDRLYRSMRDLEQLINVAEAAGVQFETVTSGNFDLTNSAGKMVARILGSVARQESEHHAERRKEANRERAVAGQWCATGFRPFGYDKTGTPLEPEATLLRRAATDILGGRSLHSIATDWNEAGHTTVRGVPWTNLHLRRVLLNPRIAALRVHQGQIVGAGTWEPILDEVLWRGLTAFLSDPSRKKGLAFERRYMGSGIYRCGICDRPLYAGYPHGRDKPMAYTCRPTAHIGRTGAPLDALVEGIVLGYLYGNDIGPGLRENEQEVDVAELRNQRAALVASKNQLGTLFGKGVIDAVQLENGSIELNAQIADINKQLADASRISPLTGLLGDDPEALADDDELIQRWKAASPDIKGKIIAELMDVVVKPAPRGVRRFDPDLIEIRWRTA